MTKRKTWDELSDHELFEAGCELRKREPLAGFDGVDWSRLPDGEFLIRKENAFREIKKLTKRQKTRVAATEIEAEKRHKERMTNGSRG